MIKYCFSGALALAVTTLFAQGNPAAQKYPTKLAGTLAVDPLKYANPFVGTGGHGHTFPGPVVPFGMVQPGPDTRYEGWDGCSGYHYSDSMIYGFSQTHLSGTGIPDYSDLLIVPQVGKATKIGKYVNPKKGYGSTFSHQNEIATPGFYSVSLDNPQVDVRLTATKRCAVHEYTFRSKKGKKYILLDLGYRDRVLDANAGVKGNNEVTGYRVSQAWASKQSFFFDLQTSVPFTKAHRDIDAKRNMYTILLEFPETTTSVTLRIGVSGTDEQGAANNLAAEATHWDFNRYMKEAQDAWRTQLSAVQFTTADQEVTANFYTALYHAYVHPSLWTDVDGRYRDYNNVIRKSETDLYSVFSIWDTYRAANPLYTFLQPGLSKDIVESYYQQYVDMGTLPVWTLSNNETYCMIGYHAVSVITDAYKKGIPLRNPEELLKAMIATSNYDHFAIKPYAANGFVAASEEAESVSKTLEYAYDDWTISQFAKALGKDSIAAVYAKRAESWLNLYNPETGFFQARDGGMWLTNFQPNEVNHHFTEANAWQYSLAVPHNIAHLTRLKGGKANMENFLDSLFHTSSVMSGREQADITGLIGQYAHGNEPSHHMAYLYNYVDKPSKTQELIDRIQREHYRNRPDGLSGNEDCGQMSAWYVFSAMGFYPVAPGSTTYTIGRPLMDKLSIKMARTGFGIEVIGNSRENKYIQSINWNGDDYRKLYITHDMITRGGLLTITMGPSPNPALDKYETDLAGDISSNVIAAPYFAAPGKVFSESIEIAMEKLPGEQGVIVYTTDGSDPLTGRAAQIYDKPFSLYESATVKAVVVRPAEKMNGPVVASHFVKFTQDKELALSPQYANQYSGGSRDALIDGQNGGLDYRSIGWQGFQTEDVTAQITLNEARDISKVTVNALQDTKSWIFYPKAIRVEVSEDGKSYKKVAAVNNKAVSDRLEGTVIRPISAEFPPVKAKYVKVIVENYGICPAWHLGAGGNTWIFMDEITVE